MSARDLPSLWRLRASELKPYAPGVAEAFERAASELEAALRAEEAAPLTLGEAARESGYSAERLRHLVASGEVPNAGRKGAPRIRRGDLPRKPRPAAGAGAFDPDAAARRMLEGRA